MSQYEKVTERATAWAQQARAAAGPLTAQAREKAVPYINQVIIRSEPLVGRAADVTAQGVSTVAHRLDQATGHKYTGPLSRITSTIDSRLRPPRA